MHDHSFIIRHIELEEIYLFLIRKSDIIFVMTLMGDSLITSRLIGLQNANTILYSKKKCNIFYRFCKEMIESLKQDDDGV